MTNTTKPYIILACDTCVDWFELRVDEPGYERHKATQHGTCDYCSDLTGRPKYKLLEE